MSAEWKVWSTTRPTLVELDPDATSPETAVAAACAWNIDADGGWWFDGGVATLGVESPTGERWTCAVWVRPGAAFDSTTLDFSPMVPYVPKAPPERDPRYDPRPGDTYRTDRTYAGGVVYTVETRRGDLLVLRTPAGDRTERSVAWWSAGACTAVWSSAAPDARG